MSAAGREGGRERERKKRRGRGGVKLELVARRGPTGILVGKLVRVPLFSGHLAGVSVSFSTAHFVPDIIIMILSIFILFYLFIK